MNQDVVDGVCVADGLFTWPSEQPQLIGSTCTSCELVTFPAEERCLRCGAEGMKSTLLSRTGSLYTWTSQGFRPPSPPYVGEDEFTPFAVGYIELAEGVLVESRLTESESGKLRIGGQMELQIIPYYHRPDGIDVLTFAFAPIGVPA